MKSKFEIFRGRNGGFYFRLKDASGRIILKSEKYSSFDSVTAGIESVKKNSSILDHFEKREAKDGRHYFVLKAKNGQIVGVSDFYVSRTGREGDLIAVSETSGSADIVK